MSPKLSVLVTRFCNPCSRRAVLFLPAESIPSHTVLSLPVFSHGSVFSSWSRLLRPLLPQKICPVPVLKKHRWRLLPHLKRPRILPRLMCEEVFCGSLCHPPGKQHSACSGSSDPFRPIGDSSSAALSGRHQQSFAGHATGAVQRNLPQGFEDEKGFGKTKSRQVAPQRLLAEHLFFLKRI